MIYSMTAFGIASIDTPQGSVSVEIRSVNSRFLDLHFRLPDELRHLEYALRERLSQTLKRGKVEVRAHIKRSYHLDDEIRPEVLQRISSQLEHIRHILPDTPSPRMSELLIWGKQDHGHDEQFWHNHALHASDEALKQLVDNRLREGSRLTTILKEMADQLEAKVQSVEQHIPTMLEEQKQRIAKRLHESLSLALPSGLQFISGAELTERLTHEASLFGLRVDVAEELARLSVHIKELSQLLENSDKPVGKRLDFLFQEMNREANTLGSKAGDIQVTQAAMDLKLLIEQMKEQIQNLE